MTTAIFLPDHEFPIHVPLYDIPNADSNRIFSIYGGSLQESLVNHAGRQPGVAFGEVNVEDFGVRQMGQDNFIRYEDLGELSPNGFTIVVAFLTPVENMASGLVNLWSKVDKNADSQRRRIFTDGSAGGAGPLRAHAYPSPSGDETLRRLGQNSPCVISMSRTGYGVTGYLRLHRADGTVISENPFPGLVGAVSYSAQTVLEVGNGSNSWSGGCLIQGIGLWSGVMAPAAINEAAAGLAAATGVFG